MFKSKVFKILKKLSDKELARFILFVKSPYYNNRKAVIAIAELMRANSFDFNGEWLMRESLFAEIFPNEPYRYKRISQQMSYLNELALEFMSQIESEREVAVRRVLAGIQCVMHGLNSVARDMLKDAKRIAEQSPYRDGEYFYAKIPISIIRSIVNEGDIHDLECTNNVQKAIDVWYLHNKLHYSSIVLSKQKLLNDKNNIPLLSEILAGLKEHEYLKTPLVGLYYHSLMMNYDGTEPEKHYHLFSSLFIAHSQELPLPDREALYTKATNFCLKRYISGETEYLREAFRHDKHAELQGFLVDQGILSDRSFKTTVSLALECGETEWAERFIEKYSQQLPKKTQKTTIALVRAELECCRGNFDTARQRLSSFKKVDDFDYVKIQTLLMRMDFEEKRWYEINQYSEHIRKFFERNESISDEYKNRTRSLFNFAGRIAKAVSSERNNPLKVIDKIEQEVMTVPVNSKPWLWGQIEKLKNQTEFVIPVRKTNRKKIVSAVRMA